MAKKIKEYWAFVPKEGQEQIAKNLTLKYGIIPVKVCLADEVDKEMAKEIASGIALAIAESEDEVDTIEEKKYFNSELTDAEHKKIFFPEKAKGNSGSQLSVPHTGEAMSEADVQPDSQEEKDCPVKPECEFWKDGDCSKGYPSVECPVMDSRKRKKPCPNWTQHALCDDCDGSSENCMLPEKESDE